MFKKPPLVGDLCWRKTNPRMALLLGNPPRRNLAQCHRCQTVLLSISNNVT